MKHSSKIECSNVVNGSSYVSKDLQCNEKFQDDQMMKFLNETKVVTYKLVLQNERTVSFRKVANANGVPIVKNHEYLNINSTDYCVS